MISPGMQKHHSDSGEKKSRGAKLEAEQIDRPAPASPEWNAGRRLQLSVTGS